jgi:branched-chain amino acid transport system permease protein
VRPALGGWLLLAGLVAIAWALEWFVVPWTDAYVTSVAKLVAIKMLAVVGLALVLGFTGQFSIGHAGFMAVGAYVAGYLSLHAGTPPLLCIVVGMVAAAIAGLAVGLPTLRLGGDYLAIVTLGFNGIIIVAIQNMPAVGGSLGMIGLPQWTNLGWALTFLLVGGFSIRNLLRSSHGRLFMAVRDNEVALRSLGIDTTRVKVTAFVVGAAWAGAAGGLVAFLNASISPALFTYDRSIELLAMCVMGGTGSLSGPILAGGILSALPEVLRPVAEYRMVLYSLLLILVMILRPAGLLGRHELTDLARRAWRWRTAA